MLKNVYFFLKISCKIATASGDPPPKIPAGLKSLGNRPLDPCVVILT